MMGEEWLFQEMMEHNVRTFVERDIQKIICLSPHDYDAFNHYYVGIEGKEVRHYTQILNEAVDKGVLKPKRVASRKVTYHDPCYLGRQNDIFNEPRKVISSIPGIELVEMKRSRETALCCGGGGTGLFLEVPRVHIDKARADQIQEVGAAELIVTCPNCYQMLFGAINSRGYDVQVRDLSELLLEAL
jgi:Fe-S oxidoreductase